MMQEEKWRRTARERVERGVAFIENTFGRDRLYGIDQTVDIESGFNCALARVTDMFYADAIKVHRLEERAPSLGFVGDENCPMPILTEVWRARSSRRCTLIASA